MESVISYIRLMPATKSEQETAANQIISAIHENQVDALEVKLYLDSIKKTIELVDKSTIYKSKVIEEAQRYNEKTFGLKGAKITVAGRTSYDYSVCNDEVLNDLLAQQKQLELMIKNRQEMLKIGVNPETGEQLKKPVENYTEYLTIKF